jgi:hypothetical protein
MNATIKNLIIGVLYSKKSSLNVLNYDILRLIVKYFIKEHIHDVSLKKELDFQKYQIANNIHPIYFSWQEKYNNMYLEQIDSFQYHYNYDKDKNRDQDFNKYGYFSETVSFPEPTNIINININMMPIKPSWPYDTIPEYLKSYIPLIEKCDIDRSQYDKICYLTIQESIVPENGYQRTPGLHTEAARSPLSSRDQVVIQRWGGFAIGGIYVASNVNDSTRIYNTTVDDCLISRLGTLEFLRPELEKRGYYQPKANKISWMTDQTPHEALPVTPGTLRQFFRLVMSDVSVWYSKHSTPNPLGLQPDPLITSICHESKFI